MSPYRILVISFSALLSAWMSFAPGYAQVCNLKVVTDANPDCSDMASLIHSATSRWSTPEEKCWAMFYWNHIARRQTAPMILHGRELTDAIRQFNDYGYTMCSTVAGVNTSIWHHMGLKVKFWDISLHTVSECEYGGRWHIYDNSMSAIYTLCDGVTIAGVEDVGKEGACSASGGRKEPGHIARYHCLNGTSANGYLTGADTPRDLAQEYRCFKPSGLKFREYYNNWEWGHRYILNLRQHESYTRYYHKLGDEPQYFVPNGGKDPEAVNERYHIRGNGVWKFAPSLAPGDLEKSGFTTIVNLHPVAPAGLQPSTSGTPGELVFKIQSANVTTGQLLRASIHRKSASDVARIAISTTNGRQWREIWSASDVGTLSVERQLVGEVNGAYETLFRITLQASADPADVRLEQISVETTTMLNRKTQPSLRLGRNEVYVGAGEQTDSIVCWPDLQGDHYKPYVVEEKNIATAEKHPGYQGVMFAERPREDAYVVFRVDAPAPITSVTYGGRFYNRARNAEIEMLHSFDEGRTWQSSFSLRETEMPWDDIHYETVTEIPSEQRSVWMKYRLRASETGASACSIYSVRMEVHHQPLSPGVRPLDVTFNWKEVQPDRTLVARSHTQKVDKLPLRYIIQVGGADHPVVDSLRVATVGAESDAKHGYSDGKEVGGEKWQDRWVTYGPNVLEGKPYRVSVAPTGQWGGDDPQSTKLTDGIVGPNYAGGIAPGTGGIWDAKGGPLEITVDMGRPESIAACRIHLTAGWPWWDALQGEIRDEVEVLTSTDGENFESQGKPALNLWRKDIPINFMLSDEETACGWNYLQRFPTTITARYVRYKVTPKRALCITEVQALKWVKDEPFDLRVALPVGKH